jgi:hypothetical protein
LYPLTFDQVEGAEIYRAELNGKSRSGHPCTAVMPDNICCVDELIPSNHQITTVELCSIRFI